MKGVKIAIANIYMALRVGLDSSEMAGFRRCVGVNTKKTRRENVRQVGWCGGEDSGRLEELRGRREIKDGSTREVGSCQVL